MNFIQSFFASLTGLPTKTQHIETVNLTSNSPVTILHNLNQQFVTVQVYAPNSNNTYDQIIVNTITLIDNNNISISVKDTVNNAVIVICGHQ